MCEVGDAGSLVDLAREYELCEVRLVRWDVRCEVWQELGRGSYGRVQRAVSRASGEQFAAKQVERRAAARMANQEARILAQLHVRSSDFSCLVNTILDGRPRSTPAWCD